MSTIPNAHKKYDLLPWSQKMNWEFIYRPRNLTDLLELKLMRYRKEIVLHGLSSLDKYLKHLEKLDRDFSPVINNFHEEISLLKNSIVATNNKAEWSVCRYVGKQKKVEDDLTKGRCYYWPSAINANFFRGIVDDEEYDSYLYKIYEADWEILEDPSGMARRVLSGNADYEKEFYEAEKYKFDREFFEINSKDEANFFVKYDCASDNFFEHGKIYHVVGIINAGYNKGCYVIDFGDDGFGFQSATITDAAGFRKV